MFLSYKSKNVNFDDNIYKVGTYLNAKYYWIFTFTDRKVMAIWLWKYMGVNLKKISMFFKFYFATKSVQI